MMQLLPIEMGTPAKLRIILEDDDIRKLVLPSGIPSTLQDLIDVIQETFHIPGVYSDVSRHGFWWPIFHFEFH